MSSSLASQLAQVRTLNANRLAGAKSARQVQSTSYLFSPSVASTQDLATLHGLAENGWEGLCNGDSTFAKWNAATGYADLLFGEASRDLDRLTKTKEENTTIDNAIADFLHLVGDSLLDRSAGKCIEWLVRRFRAHEYNASNLLAAFIPFHETKEFAKMLQILQLQDKPQFSFLIPVQKQAIPLPSSVLLSSLLESTQTTSSTAILRWVVNLPFANKDRSSRRYMRQQHVLYSFWVSTIVKLCSLWSGKGDLNARMGLNRSKGKKKQTRDDDAQLLLSIILPAVFDLLHDSAAAKDAPEFAALAICAIADAFELSYDAAKSTISSITDSVSQPQKTRTALLSACACVVGRQKDAHSTSSAHRLIAASQAKALATMIGDGSALSKQMSSLDLNPFLLQLSIALLDIDEDSVVGKTLSWALDSVNVTSDEVAAAIVRYALVRASEENFSSDILDVLCSVRQRRTIVWETAYKATQLLGESSRAKADKVLGAMLARQAGANAADDESALWLDIHSADSSARANAVRTILSSIKAGSLSESDPFVKDALTSALEEQDADVLSIVYSNPDILVSSVGVDKIIDTLDTILSRTDQAVKTSRAAVALHAKFLVADLMSQPFTSPQQRMSIWWRLIWPRLLFVKSDRKSCVSFHKALGQETASSLSGTNVDDICMRRMSLIAAVAQLIENEEYAKANMQMAESLGRHMAQEVDHVSVIDFLVKQAFNESARDISIRARLLASMTLRSYLSHAQGKALEIASQKISVQLLASAGAFGHLDETTAIKDSQLGEAVYTKSTHHRTNSKTLAALLVTLARHCPLDGCTTLTQDVTGEESAVPLNIFIIATKSLLHVAEFAFSVIDITLARLGNVTPTFLALLWSSSDANGDWRFEPEVRFMALRFATTYFAASATKSAKAVDFQAILPSLLLGLKDVEKRNRLEALSSLHAVRQLYAALSNAQNSVDIFGYDKLYGSITADSLTYLDAHDAEQLLNSLLEAKLSFVNDRSYADTWMQTNIAINKGEDKKRVVAYKAAIAHWLASHALCWNNVLARTAILTMLSGVSHESKLRTLLPLVREIVDAKHLEYSQWPAGLVNLLFNLYDKSAKSFINADEEASWTIFKHALERGPTVVRQAAANSLRHQTFAVLHSDKQIEALMLLAGIVATSNTPVPQEIRTCLVNVRLDTASVLVPVLIKLRESIGEHVLRSQPRAKRSRIEGDAEVEAGLASTSILLELLEASLSHAAKANQALLAELFDCLRLGVELLSAKGALAEQLLQVTMANLQLCLPVAGSEETFPDPMRVEAIINVIKTPCRPQTFQQALLLLSLIGQSNPDVVLHHSMPIFTFVGNTMLQRDDEHSFNVIQSTLQSILPPVVERTRRNLSQSKAADLALELQQGSRSLLCIFTDAATHIPRHRRQNFFYSLTKVMGAAEYLAPIAMLLVDRQSYKAAKLLTDEERTTALQLPLSLYRRAANDEDVDVLLACLGQVWNETMRTWLHRSDDPIEMQEHVYLDCIGNVELEHEGRKMDPVKRVLSLLYFAKLAVIENREALEDGRQDESEEETKKRNAVLQSIVQQALALMQVDVSMISEAAQDALDEIMTIVSVPTLEHVVTALLQGSEASLLRNGLQIFATSIDDMLDTERRQASVSLTPRVIAISKGVVQSYLTEKGSKAIDDLLPALQALSSIAHSAVSSESGALAEMLGPVCTLVGSASEDELVKPTLTLLQRLCSTLGPRLIPSLAHLVQVCIARMTKGSITEQRLVLGVLTALIKSVPTFMSTHLVALFDMCISITRNEVAELDADLRKLVATVNRLVTPGDVLQAVSTTFSQGNKSHVALFLFCLDVVQLNIRSLDKRKTHAHHKTIFRFLISCFDTRRQRNADADQWSLTNDEVGTIEARSVSVFVRLVFRLNENVFRPLFLRMCDWALLDLVEDDDANDAEKDRVQRERRARQIVLYKVLNALLGELGELVSHYYVNVLDATIETLQGLALAFSTMDEESSTLWSMLLTSIKLSCNVDSGTFWNATRAKKLLPNIVAQIRHATTTTSEKLLADVLSSVCQTVSDESTVKLTNDLLLDIARTADDGQASRGQSHTRLVAVGLLERVWRTKGCEDALLGLVPNTVPSVAELLQESEESLQQAMSGFVGAIEDILGEDLDSYLQ